jgi:heme iron utilization protein
MGDSLSRLDELLATQPLAVLATSHDGAPYASLVAVAPEGQTTVYFATPRATRKWGNVTTEPRVALMIDDRSNQPADFHAGAAATAMGIAVECCEDGVDVGRQALLRRHPHLRGFLTSPSTVIARIDVERWYVVTRFQSVDCITPGQATK